MMNSFLALWVKSLINLLSDQAHQMQLSCGEVVGSILWKVIDKEEVNNKVETNIGSPKKLTHWTILTHCFANVIIKTMTSSASTSGRYGIMSFIPKIEGSFCTSTNTNQSFQLSLLKGLSTEHNLLLGSNGNL